MPLKNEKEQECYGCHYARGLRENVKRCHRYPPDVTRAGGKGTMLHRFVSSSDWCGEWRKRRGKLHGETK
jgi:hypothetical protein